ncbi:MAG: hypothetical protein LAO51_07135 [Acidobacteriia bacterium]|nr:hypothetical protein [Terriglobia bacterium]
MNPDREWFRVRELRAEFGFSKPWVFARLHEGTLRGRKVGGILLIEAASVKELIANAPAWEPKEPQP